MWPENFPAVAVEVATSFGLKRRNEVDAMIECVIGTELRLQGE